ncbi:MAG: long-chain fatty acid--CoA ligase [Bacteroides sp.]|jgi:fatty-acyl-CoA synthase|nr:long-chain fatty acid--CoA ligase [Bacteroides sp.]
MSWIDWFGRWNMYNPSRVAIEEYETGRAFTYGQFHQLGNFTARWFADELNLEKGDRLAILAENCLEYITLLAVAQKTGLIIVPLNYRLTPHELRFMLGDARPKITFVEEKFRDKFEGIENLNELTRVLPLEDLSARSDAFVKSGEMAECPAHEVTEDDAALIIYTSGTTAFPKGSIYTHKMMFWNSINTQLRLDLTADDRSINCAPPFHTGSWNVLETPFLHHGAYTLMMRTFDPGAVLKALDERDMTIFWAVPTMLKLMQENPGYGKAKLEKVRYFVVGGEAMPIPLIEQWHQKGIFIRQGYGLTEVGPNVMSLNHQDATRKAGSIGKPNFYYEVRIVDDKGENVPTGEVGEFLLKGPTVTPGYWNNPEATADTIHNGWFHTGDLVRRDEEGFIYVVDRIKNMYISGAENVYPAEVEYLLRKHPAVDEVAIIGVPDPKWGETGKAFIVPQKNIKVTIEDILDFCAGKLAKYKIPRHVVFLEELPKNHAGKIDRKKLKENE